MKKLQIIFGLFCALFLLCQGGYAQVSYRIQKLTNGSYKASIKSGTAYSGSTSILVKSIC